MTNSEWWARVVQTRTAREDLLPNRVWALRKGAHVAAMDVKAVPGIGAEIVLTVNDELRRSRLFRSHEQAELVGANCGHADDVRGKRVGVMKFNALIVRRAERVMVAGAIVLVRVAYRISKALSRRSGGIE